MKPTAEEQRIKPKPELTREQINMTVDMLERINNCMKKDGDDWYDTGDFILMLSNHEMKTFRKLIKTLNTL